MADLTDEKIEWLNGYVTPEDLKNMGVTRQKRRWQSLRRWQAANLAHYALGDEPPHGPNKDPRFVV